MKRRRFVGGGEGMATCKREGGEKQVSENICMFPPFSLSKKAAKGKDVVGIFPAFFRVPSPPLFSFP